MTTVLFVRHGLTGLTGSQLVGWTPGVHLDERGRSQARMLAERLSQLPLTAVVSSPLERCLETAEAVVEGRDGLRVTADERVGECRYGDWTGRGLAKLAKEDLWRVVQEHPSAARFPGQDGESLADTQHRAVSAVRDWNTRLGANATYAVCSHGDVIKAIIADALGLHLDFFQRIRIDPASLTVVDYTQTRPFLVRLNDTGGVVDDLVPRPPKRRSWWRRRRSPREGDAPVGGGAGTT